MGELILTSDEKSLVEVYRVWKREDRKRPMQDSFSVSTAYIFGKDGVGVRRFDAGIGRLHFLGPGRRGYATPENAIKALARRVKQGMTGERED